jgi:hypothetical protein
MVMLTDFCHIMFMSTDTGHLMVKPTDIVCIMVVRDIGRLMAEKTERLASKTHTDTSGKPLEEPSSST